MAADPVASRPDPATTSGAGVEPAEPMGGLRRTIDRRCRPTLLDARPDARRPARLRQRLVRPAETPRRLGQGRAEATLEGPLGEAPVELPDARRLTAEATTPRLHATAPDGT